MFYGQDEVGIFITPKEPKEIPFEKQARIIKQDLLDIEEPVQEIKEQEEQVQETTGNNNWWEKYK